MSEAQHQTALFDWAERCKARWPELEMLFAVPNGGSRHKIEASRLKRQGVKAGVADIFLDVARQGYHGLRIELKRPAEGGKRKGTVSVEQKEWIERWLQHGYFACVCYGWDEARTVIENYIGFSPTK